MIGKYDLFEIICDGCGATIGSHGYYLYSYLNARGTVPYVCKTCHDEHYGVSPDDELPDDGCPACGNPVCSGRCT